MSRIQQLLRPARRSQPGARMLFPLLGLVAAGLATYAWAESRDDEPGITMHGTLHLDDKRHGDSFALVRGTGDEMHMWGSLDDIDAIKSARQGRTGDYLWFRRNDRAYLVTDPTLLARALEATRETDEPERRLDELEAQMEPHSQKLELLEERMDALSEEAEPGPRAEAAERQLDFLGRKQEMLADRQEALVERMEDAGGDEKLVAQLALQIDELAAQQDELGRQMVVQARVMDEEYAGLEARHAPMEALAREMELASEPMEAIGEQMEVQGRLIEEASARVEIELRKIIDEAVARNLAINP